MRPTLILLTQIINFILLTPATAQDMKPQSCHDNPALCQTRDQVTTSIESNNHKLPRCNWESKSVLPPPPDDNRLITFPFQNTYSHRLAVDLNGDSYADYIDVGSCGSGGCTYGFYLGNAKGQVCALPDIPDLALIDYSDWDIHGHKVFYWSDTEKGGTENVFYEYWLVFDGVQMVFFKDPSHPFPR